MPTTTARANASEFTTPTGALPDRGRLPARGLKGAGEVAPPEPVLLMTAPILATTGGEWDRGISTLTPRFLLGDTVARQEAFVVDNTVKFAEGSVRTITQVTVNFGNIFVTVSGAMLDPATMGYPNSVEVYAA